MPVAKIFIYIRLHLTKPFAKWWTAFASDLQYGLAYRRKKFEMWAAFWSSDVGERVWSCGVCVGVLAARWICFYNETICTHLIFKSIQTNCGILSLQTMLLLASWWWCCCFSPFIVSPAKCERSCIRIRSTLMFISMIPILNGPVLTPFIFFVNRNTNSASTLHTSFPWRDIKDLHCISDSFFSYTTFKHYAIVRCDRKCLLKALCIWVVFFLVQITGKSRQIRYYPMH